MATQGSERPLQDEFKDLSKEAEVPEAPGRASGSEEAVEPQEQEALIEFHFFPKLPIELRLQIWEHALPRVGTFNLQVDKSEFNKMKLGQDFSTLLGTYPSEEYIVYLIRTLAILLACKESNQILTEKLPHITPMKDLYTDTPYANLRFGNHDTIGINDITFLRMQERWWDSMKSIKWIGSVKNINLSFNPMCIFEPFEWEDILKMFKSAQKITVDLRFGRPGYKYIPARVAHWWHKRLEALELLRARNVEGLVIPEVLTESGGVGLGEVL